MATTTQTVVTIPKADFTTSAGVVNSSIFLQELVDLALPVAVEGVSQVGTDVIITLTGLAVSGNITAITGAATSHTGAAFSSPTQRTSNPSVVSAPSITEVETESLTTGALPAGDYEFSWYVEHQAVVSGARSEIRAYISVNGALETEVGFHSTPNQQYLAATGTYSLPLVDGDDVTVRTTVARSAAGSGSANARRSRLVFKRDA